MTGPYKSRPVLIVLDGVRLRQQNKFIFSSENLVVGDSRLPLIAPRSGRCVAGCAVEVDGRKTENRGSYERSLSRFFAAGCRAELAD
jgi:hypothetical protein